jgi:NDP-sugar pyrophosphorylase family protein
MIEVLVLAGGLATRLRPYTNSIPKSLIDVAGRPFIYHQLDFLLGQGVKRVIFCLGYFGDMIESQIGSKYKGQVDIVYSFDGAQLLGTGGAIENSLDLISGQCFFVTYGDSYLLQPLEDVYFSFREKQCDALLTVYKNNNKWDVSNCIFDGENVSLYDKRNYSSEMQYIDYGLSLFNRKIFEACSFNAPYDLGDVFNFLSTSGRLSGFEAKSRFYEMGSVAGLLEMSDYFIKSNNDR